MQQAGQTGGCAALMSALNLDTVFDGYSAIKGWWRGTVVERRSLTGELSVCARPAADG